MKQYEVYKITNTIDDRIYIGIHKRRSNEKLRDYMGSGIGLTEDQQLLGMGVFDKEVLVEFDSLEEALAEEARLVDWKFVRDPNTYNRIPGGNNGWWGYVSAIDKSTGKKVRIPQHIFVNNRDAYDGHTVGMRVVLRDGEWTQIPVDEVLPTDKTTTSGKTVVVSGGGFTLIDSDEYQANKDKYTHMGKNMVVIRAQNGDILKVSRDQLYQYEGFQYVGMSSKGEVRAKRLSTGEVATVSVDEFYADTDLVGHTVGMVAVRCKDTGKTFQITREEFEKGEYEAVRSGLVCAIDTRTGKTVSVPKHEFDALNSPYVGVSTGRVWINKNQQSKSVPSHDVQQWIDKGWQLGNLNGEKLSNKKWMNNGVSTIRVNAEEVNVMIERGFVLGRIKWKPQHARSY